MSTTLKDKLESLNGSKIENISQVILNTEQQTIIQKTFIWMSVITFIVFAVGYYVLSMLKNNTLSVAQYTTAFRISMFGGLALVFVISWFWQKMNYMTLSVLALLFAVLEGVGLSGVLAYYSASSVINAFAGAGILFLIMALYGYFTKQDLTKFGSILIIGLISLIVLTLLNVFLIKSQSFDLVLSIIGLLLFLGIVAWNLQTLKLAALTGDKRLEIVFGISLYLDFINIFLYLLRIFGSSDR